ncbi:F-box domain-containing protein [Mycena venus]|uniref:F-box domain-containing protein n=1 Tax=Mycena venus TaxID=2733690 RepID=A0A8H6XK13_9AGAR|nr:F-box domain-containing protein [Mycena venus]
METRHQTSPLVTDSVLEALAPNLAQLKQFSLTGCLRVTHRGVWAVLSANTAGGLRVLALEGLAAKFLRPHTPTPSDLAALSAHCADTVLARLQSFTLSVHSTAWLASTAALLAHAPSLEIVQLYAADPLAFAPNAATAAIMDAFWRDLVTTHGKRLTRVSVHRMAISLRAIEDVCVRCTALRQLYVVVDPTALGALANCLSRARVLSAVHINFPTISVAADDDDDDNEWLDDDDHDREEVPVVLKAPEALAIVRRCPDTISLFGCNARVWQVEREVRRNDAGELVVERYLAGYESPDVPEQFLVVRT